MRSLTLLRHAKSSWDDDSLDDFERPLNGRGQRSAEAMGRYLAEEGKRFDLVLASPARRVAETIRGLTESGWDADSVHFDRDIYHAGMRGLIGMLKAVPGHVRRLMLVGHNPAMGMLAVYLTRDDPAGLRQRASLKYPTGTLAEIELDIDEWVDVDAQSGLLTAFVTPRSLGA